MKKITVVIPTYNEHENVVPLAEAIIDQFQALPNYDYELLFIDNDSHDETQQLIESMASNNKRIKAIFNAKNFGQWNSPHHAMCVADGDCVILMCADFQDPVELIPTLIAEWENGHKLVTCIKTASLENKVMRFLRTIYYKLIKSMSQIEQIEHFTGFGLYDRTFLNVLRELDDPTPFLRGIVAELGFDRKNIEYTQAARRAGKTKHGFYSLYDAAMLSFTSYTKIGLRIATIIGFVASIASLCVALYYVIMKLLFWDTIPLGTASIITGVYLLGSLQLFFIGLIGEYIMSMNTRIMKRPLVVEARRINFDE